MKKVLFIDPTCPTPYTIKYLNNNPSGASELCLLQVARAIQKYSNSEIYFVQQDRKELASESKIKYYNQEFLTSTDNDNDIDAIVLQRDPRTIPYLQKKYPNAKIVLFQHDFFEGGALATTGTKELENLKDSKIPIIALTNWHKENLIYNFKLRNLVMDHQIKIIPHFVVSDLRKMELKLFKNIKRDKNKLCFFSSSHKGLAHTIEAFKFLHRINRNFVLYIANPSYRQYEQYQIDYIKTLQNDEGLPIINLGGIARKEILKHLQESLCVLSVNAVYPETFGMIHAEANAMGTPNVLLDYGANREVVFNPAKEIIYKSPYSSDPIGYREIINRVQEYHNIAIPLTTLKPEFLIENVYPKWLNLLGLYEI